MMTTLQSQPFLTLALSGGNALGAYAAGACEALLETGQQPVLISGASMGAVNAAILAGNPPETRIERLKSFWKLAGEGSLPGPAPATGPSRDFYNRMHAMQTFFFGRPGLFVPRVTGFWSLLPGTPPDVALFDSKPIIATFESVIDFDYLAERGVPIIVTCVDIETGEPVCFDSRQQRIEPRHLLASTAFVPGFPPVEVDGRWLADAGVYCNLPLDPLLDTAPAGDHRCIAIDLFDARGPRPSSIDTGLERAQDLSFSAQSARVIEARCREHRLRWLVAQALDGAPSDSPAMPHVAEGRHHRLDLAWIAYRAPLHELGAKTIEFSAASIDDRWQAGRQDMDVAIRRLGSGDADSRALGVSLYDCRRRDAA